jgi:hypothetical protein
VVSQRSLPPARMGFIYQTKIINLHTGPPQHESCSSLHPAELDQATAYTQAGGWERNFCQLTLVFSLIVVCVPMESRIHACMEGSHVQTGRLFGIIVLRIRDERLKD